MKLVVIISEEAERALRTRAKSEGLDESTLASRLLERTVLGGPDLRAISGEIYEAFEQSGMTEEQLADVLEAEKHAMRAERRKKAS